jgi:hypothetical protein
MAEKETDSMETVQEKTAVPGFEPEIAAFCCEH